MKECKILHVHDGDVKVIENENFHLMEEYPWAEETINGLLKQGYEVKQMIPQVSPAIPEEEKFSFYLSGFMVYLEREV